MRKPKNRLTEIVKDASPLGYTYLHATRGWKRMSQKRIIAQRKLAQLLGA